MLKSLWNQVVAKLAQAWNWLLGQTTIDEKIVEKVDNAKRTITVVKNRVEDVVEEVQDVIEAVKEASEDIMEEVNDVVEAVKSPIVIEGKVTKSKLRALKKQDLVDHARANFDTELEVGLTKTNLINKVYELHHKK
jgi:esterase/lipase